MTWTNISKPGIQSWIGVYTAGGREVYDDPSVFYDSSTTYYDGLNPDQWTEVAKPATPASWVSIAKPS